MDNWEEFIEWDDLIAEILQEQCILILGPDLVSFPGFESFFRLLTHHLNHAEKLRKNLELNTSFIFEHDELLQLQPNARDTALYNFLTKFYSERNEFEAPYRQIAQIPFHAVISLLPDQRLKEIYTQLGFDLNFEYFPRTQGSTRRELAEAPSREKPLIYNLMGVLTPPDAVLTFDDYFQYLQGILPENALPPLLDSALENAISFLFLGVHFEKWNIQLLLRKIVPYSTMKKRRSTYSLLKGSQDSDSYTFIARRLELNFHSIEPIDFLSELYRRFQERALLKQPVRIFRKKIFISYGHGDSIIVEDIRTRLDKVDIEVIMDKTNIPVGERIRQFMTTVKFVDKVVVMLSKSSLRSPWVSKEVTLTLENNKSLIPCYLDEYFLNKDYVPETQTGINNKLRDIDLSISQRNENNRLGTFEDLQQERELWREFGINLPHQAAGYQGSKCIALDEENYKDGLDTLINIIVS